MRQITFEGVCAYFAGLALGAGVVAMLTLLSSCGTLNGMASDIEVAARTIKEETTSYTERSIQPRIVYTAKETSND